MKAQIKRTGKIIEGKAAEAFVKIGLAEEIQEEKPLTAKEVSTLIVACETVDELEQFKDDKRQVVKTAYNKKLKELE